MEISCPLCSTSGELFCNRKNKDYYQCPRCSGIYIDPAALPSHGAEKERYGFHNTTEGDKGYEKFVAPLLDSVVTHVAPGNTGLDFGAGERSVIAVLLRKRGFDISEYDPFFQDNRLLLDKKYDYIIACEVIEHFHQPAREFSLLKNLLQPGGRLFCMTHLYDPSIDFHSWYYVNDFTHVYFYSEETIRWIAGRYGFSDVIINGRVIILGH